MHGEVYIWRCWGLVAGVSIVGRFGGEAGMAGGACPRFPGSLDVDLEICNLLVYMCIRCILYVYISNAVV